MKPKRRRPRLVASFDDLMEKAYGAHDERLLRPASSAGRLLNRYYGHEPRRRKQKCTPASRVEVGCDDAQHTLNQRRRNGAANGVEAARVTQPPSVPRAVPLPTVAVAPLASPPLPVVPIAPAPASTRSTPPALAPAVDAVPSPAGTSDVAPAMANSLFAHHKTAPEDTSALEDDFIADMKSILDGAGAYDKDSKKVVPRSASRDNAREMSQAQSAPYNGIGEGGEGQKIFDRIAKSMRYAGAYDLGEVELENRFADFDRMDDLRNRPKQSRKPTSTKASRSSVAPIGASLSPIDSADFIQDLEAIQKQSVGAAEALRDASIDIADAMQPKLSNPSSVPGRYSAPLYATGEHARMGGDLYKDQLLVGKPPGVMFSYREIIAMADLFDDVGQMMDEDVGMLTTLRSLIQREVADGSVTTKQWKNATRNRYLRLAEDNYEHFAPNLLFPSKKFARALQYRNHKQAWEAHHERAIKEAQQMALDPAFANQSYIPTWPLIINAFGDHFLTDAFAAGHVVNKQEISEIFKSRFYQGAGLSPLGKQFFEQVAQAAWKGDVAAEFVKLESYESYDAWWNIVGWHPDIKNAERFGVVLKGAAEKEPDKIANLAVKAIHDHLNSFGIEVANDAGHEPWQLTGDGYLTPTTLAVVETAVRESAGHITDTALLASNISYPNYFAKVWKYVPKPTPSATKQLEEFIESYIHPESQTLLVKAAELIGDEANTLIEQLLDAKALRRI